MEGRSPPPKASHPLPDHPDMTKFWGTPYYKAFFKTFALLVVSTGTIMAVKIYFEGNKSVTEELNITQEEARRLQLLKERVHELKFRYALPLDYNTEVARTKGNLPGLFDDGARFYPHKRFTKMEFEYILPEDKEALDKSFSESFIP